MYPTEVRFTQWVLKFFCEFAASLFLLQSFFFPTPPSSVSEYEWYDPKEKKTINSLEQPWNSDIYQSKVEDILVDEVYIQPPLQQ